MARAKTALFDILHTRVVDMRVLDLFAGTGSVGIEALSRGARQATFVECDPRELRILRDNLQITGLAERAETIRGDAFAFLTDAAAHGRAYDLVYVAPPQYQGMALRALTMLDAAPIVVPGGLVIVQIHPRERQACTDLPLRAHERCDERRYGSTVLLFYERLGEGGDDATTEPI